MRTNELDTAHLQRELSQLALIVRRIQRIAKTPSAQDPEPDFSAIEAIASGASEKMAALRTACGCTL